MLTNPPPKHRRRKLLDVPFNPPAPPPAPLTLVAATYVAGTGITLTFDRAIEIGALVTDAFLVNDGAGTHITSVGYGEPTLLSPTSVRVPTISMSPYGGSTTTLYADEANGIVATDGGAWDGAADLVLPFG